MTKLRGYFHKMRKISQSITQTHILVHNVVNISGAILTLHGFKK